ncbi:hypothetical protein [Aquabacterium sp.]|uniref:hypothetical protein n=1 Tax=Aquabacterium sp. TaxID=1872578 RepID=UPI003D6CF8AF
MRCCDSRTAASRVLAIGAICAALAACSSRPPAPALKPASALNQDCSLVVAAGGERQINCRLAVQLPDTQVDAAHPGSVACSSTSFSVFKQALNLPIWLGYGQKGDDGPLRVRVGGTLGPGTHSAKVGQSAGNDCDATVGPVATLDARLGGRYVALVDQSQRPACVAQSSLVLSSFEQALSVPLSVNIAGVAREMTSDALQKRLDLEVATQVNKYLQPSARPLSDAVVSRNGRCPEGFRTFIGR